MEGRATMVDRRLDWRNYDDVMAIEWDATAWERRMVLCRRARANHAILWFGGVPVGTCAIMRVGRTRARLAAAFVQPAHRGQGHGEWMVRERIAVAIRWPWVESIEVRTHLPALFHRLGFTIDREYRVGFSMTAHKDVLKRTI